MKRDTWVRGAWGSVDPIALTNALYYDSGAIHFGYRFSMDFMPVLVALPAAGFKNGLSTLSVGRVAYSILMNSKNSFGVFLVIVLAGLAYLPQVNQIGYTHDDWYLMYSAGTKGPGIFWDIFGIDRPWRALVMIPAYVLFGSNPLYYHLSAYLFRVIGALALHGSLNHLWPNRGTATTAMSLLFAVYPGFLSQPNAIDYQSHIVGVAAALTSVVCTLKATSSPSRALQWLYHMLSIPLGLLYLGQIEWYVGFEVFRWACLLLLATRHEGSLTQKGLRAIGWGYPSLAAPLLFFVWRIFFFESQRGATDVAVQFEQVRLYPLQTLYAWTVQIVQDFFDVTVSAWVIPFSQFTGFIQRWGGLLALVSVAIAWIIFWKIQRNETEESESVSNFMREALLVGVVAVIGGLIPVVMVNREVSFPFHSRYTMVASVGAAIVIVPALMQLKMKILREGIFAGLCLIALLTHHANGVKHAQETATLNNFWWQVAWRAPQIEKNTTLVANYPALAVEEDYFVWGPANLVYHPESQNADVVQPALYAAVLNRDTVNHILARERQEFDNRRTILTYKNYRNVLVLTQPSAGSCVHVIDGLQPDFSSGESDSVRVIGSFSEIEHVLTEAPPHAPPELVFGPEPPRGWCYYYQKADLARQRGDWQAIVQLGLKAQDQGLAPADPIEWMPFLQAYAVMGHVERLEETADQVTLDPYVSLQVCRRVRGMTGLDASIVEWVNSLYCLE